MAEISAAETWDDTRIKPLYEQLMNQFRSADLDGYALTCISSFGRVDSAQGSMPAAQRHGMTCAASPRRNGVIDVHELRNLLETFEDGSDGSTTHWLTGKPVNISNHGASIQQSITIANAMNANILLVGFQTRMWPP